MAARLTPLLRRYGFLSSVGYWRALLEMVFPGGILMFLVTRYGADTANSTFLGNIASVILWAGIGYAIRLRLIPGSRRQKLVYESLNGMLLILLLSCLFIIEFLLLTPQSKLDDMFSGDTASSLGFQMTIIIIPILTVFEFSMVRALRYGWRSWNRARSRKLVWQLTHSHLALITGIVAITVMTIFTANVVANNLQAFPNYLTGIPSLLIVITALTCALSLLVLPPLSIVSYVIARRVTHRLETLAQVTSSFRTGDYQARVAVSGDDEVAQLQNDFNAMADDLERALHELGVERDAVTALLKSRRELFASVSHELRTPIATLRGYIESMAASKAASDSPRQGQDLGVMEAEILRLQRLVDDLFTVARTETGSIGLTMQSIDIVPLLEQVSAATKPLAWQKSRIELVASLPAALPPIQIDATRLEQIVNNLINNSLKHTPPGGIVVLSALSTDQEVSIQVKDTGEGIAEEDLPHIWERFYRATSAREKNIGGTGLGLALVKELTEAMGGSVAVESEPGEGSCFTITFPCAQ